jgi:hypothetical protein
MISYTYKLSWNVIHESESLKNNGFLGNEQKTSPF